ncbi:ABC transporter substrate-binding protein [Dictyobacter arantiisoli]|uniref:Riboflavin-binding protein RibY n=1 Tax=Dictyobacter arantiisoli TaxID=2014874 RepID=A0A5A5TDX8_9CHLR|nr:ABC transporter substrate-binding protein [Dictyobacter arantiisoli]GCF09498.1 riboflavin-binding protein RibY [Dictyobacter arantiisoli]
MTIYRRLSVTWSFVSLALVCVMFLAACGGPVSTSNSSGNSSTTADKSLTDVSIGLGYNPDIQFAPFYVAQSKGYYKDAGLNVTFHHGIVTDLIGTMIAGKNTFVFASGDELLAAYDKNKSLQAIDTSTIFQKYPVSLIVPKDARIQQLSDLKGHTIGVPGPFGATYTGLLALLQAGHLTTNDVKVQSIGFNQISALMSHKVDAVVGYSNNEPLQLERNGFHVRTFDVSDYMPLVSNGIITTKDTYTNQKQVVNAFVRATLKGVKDVVADPQGAVNISKPLIPGVNPDVALQVLKATIPIYQGKGNPGYNDPTAWTSTEKFLASQKVIAPITDLSQFYTNN